MTGIASVVTRDVPDYALVYGNPAKIQGWVDEKGRKMKKIGKMIWENEEGGNIIAITKNSLKPV